MAPTSALLLLRSLELLRADVPEAYALFVERLPSPVVVEIDGQPIVIGRKADRVVAMNSATDVRVVLRTSSHAILDLVDGKHGFLEAIVSERIFLAGDAAHLLEASDAVAAYLQGAVRSPRFPALLGQLRAAASSAPAPNSPGGSK
jgi:hypothetical protein